MPRQTLRDYTRVPFEIVIAVLTILPFFVLAYFYTNLPDRVPLFMKFNGEVAVWADKNVVSVFRVPSMAVITQIVVLLVKYGTLQYKHYVSSDLALEQATLHEQTFKLNASLWDWFRWIVAVKMSIESLDVILLSSPRSAFLFRPAFITTAIVVLIGVIGAVFYGYRLLVVEREMKRRFGVPVEPVDRQRVYGGIFYFNPSDSALFSRKYVFNFGNTWAWIFVACAIAYPLLVFLPS